mgnify:CR=1 FL=1
MQRVATPDAMVELSARLASEARTRGHRAEIVHAGKKVTQTHLAELQRLGEDLVVEPFDHTFLNKDVAHFAGCVPTAENIALEARKLLRQ